MLYLLSCPNEVERFEYKFLVDAEYVPGPGTSKSEPPTTFSWWPSGVITSYVPILYLPLNE